MKEKILTQWPTSAIHCPETYFAWRFSCILANLLLPCSAVWPSLKRKRNRALSTAAVEKRLFAGMLKTKLLALSHSIFGKRGRILGLRVIPSHASVEEQIRALSHDLKHLVYYPMATGKIDQTGKSVFYRGADALEYDLITVAMGFLSPTSSVKRLRGKTLTPVNDSLEDAYPNGCLPEQAIIFHDDGASTPSIIVNQDLIDRLDNQNRAALFVHEGLYRALRKLDREGNSLRTRRAIGLALSGHSFEPLASFLPEEFAACITVDPEAPYSLLILYPEPNVPNDKGIFVVKPVAIGGVYLTDFNSSRGSKQFNATTIDELVSSVFTPPDMKPESVSGSGIVSDGQVVDREFHAWFNISKYREEESKSALSINRVSAPWPTPDQTTYLSCVRAKKTDMFH